MSPTDREWSFTPILTAKLDEDERCLYQVQLDDCLWAGSASTFNQLTLDGNSLRGMASFVRPMGENELRIAWAPTWVSADEMVVNGGRAIHLFWSTKFGCVPQPGFTSICHDLLLFCN
jgi:hypothetical protein